MGASDPSLHRAADVCVAGGARSRGVAVTDPEVVVAARALRTYVLDTSVLLADHPEERAVRLGAHALRQRICEPAAELRVVGTQQCCGVYQVRQVCREMNMP